MNDVYAVLGFLLVTAIVGVVSLIIPVMVLISRRDRRRTASRERGK